MDTEVIADQPLSVGSDETHSGAEAYSGAGGNASGGNVGEGDGLIDLFSGICPMLCLSMMTDKYVREWWRWWRC
jgi:hypothetical protein